MARGIWEVVGVARYTCFRTTCRIAGATTTRNGGVPALVRYLGADKPAWPNRDELRLDFYYRAPDATHSGWWKDFGVDPTWAENPPPG